MRQLLVLVFGLMLIAVWGVGLRFALNGNGRKTGPDRIPSNSNAEPLAKHSRSSVSHLDNTQVVPAAFQQSSLQPQLVSVLDSNETPGWLWQKDMLLEPDSIVWLRGDRLVVRYNFKGQVSGTAIGKPTSGVGKDIAINPLTRDGDILPFNIDLSSIEINDFRLVLTATPSQTQSTFDLSVKILTSGSEGFRVRKPSKKGPYGPVVLEMQLSEHYPWTPVAGNLPSLSLFREITSTVGARLRTYDQTDFVLGIVIATNQSSQPADVLAVQLEAVRTQANPFPLKMAVNLSTLNFGGHQSVNLRYASVSNNASIAGHAFGVQTISATPIDNDIGTANALVTKVGNRSANPKKFYSTNQSGAPEVEVTVTSQRPITDSSVACQLFRGNQPISEPAVLKNKKATFTAAKLNEGTNIVEARLSAGDQQLTDVTSAASEIEVATNGFRVNSAGPDAFGASLREKAIQVTFSRPISNFDAVKSSLFRLKYSTSGQFDGGAPTDSKDFSAVLDSSKTIVTITPTPAAPIEPGYYELTVIGSEVVDNFANAFEGPDQVLRSNFVKTFGGAAQLAAEAYPVTPGVTRGNANMVEFPEFVQPRKVPTGFNPNDKVETRVARLYFYRDAHRVAQILNRRVQSYNRQEVAVRRQLADKARQEAESRTTNRQVAERAAVQAAQRTRELENQLSDTQRSLNSTLQQLQSAAGQPTTPDTAARQQQIIDQLQSTARSFAKQAETLESQVRSARDAEVAANERWQSNQREEDLARTDQFRMETAAAHADPDTFAEGKPDSQDPVAQVSISVIGEGLIHLRGPLKGVNQVRMMIDQIDAPQGQVRVNVHSTQINGDEADELEVVANRIQTYIDQARFLTVQSAEMLRKAVIQVAATRAEEARGLYPSASQADRDQLYLHAFFGVDFVNELRTMDSELLHTGNKLLSLHSMDVTSLSSALMLLALANNGTRLAILEEFQRLVQCDLSTAEQQFIQNGIGSCVGGCKKGCKHHQSGPPICHLAGNSSFTSLKGFFDSQLQNNDTMSPLQREAIGLAQILKARLVTEMEYKQRVMERSVIEERTQNVENSEAQLIRERSAEDEVRKAREAQVRARGIILPSIAKSNAMLDETETVLAVANNAMQGVAKFLNDNQIASIPPQTKSTALEATLRSVLAKFEDTAAIRGRYQTDPHTDRITNPGLYGTQRDLYFLDSNVVSQRLGKNEKPQGNDAHFFVYVPNVEKRQIMAQLKQLSAALKQVKQVIATFHSDDSEVMVNLGNLIFGVDRIVIRESELPIKRDLTTDENHYAIASIYEIRSAIELLLFLYAQNTEFEQKAAYIKEARESFQIKLTKFGSTNNSGSQLESAAEVFRAWSKFSTAGARLFDRQVINSTKQGAEAQLIASTAALEAWLEAVSKLDAAQSLAQDARRPLDHKKFLDMLIDELEEKYIELLEGTRAHTANIDNYLKRLTTSLDDDFNTQYYYPVFRLVREASQFKRVEFGQTETTNILVNNREFGKVSPSATMEFDLPKRDILIEEGIDSALAIYNDVGALVNDPNLLALAKMQSGSSVSSPGAGTTGGMGTVRNVLPGLKSESAEQLMAQNAGSGPKFESNVEKLIPDPAIYKFETGTGYEIRPVIAPDGQAVVFKFHYLYSTQIREPVRADEKHLGRVKQHFIDTDVQLSNFELREVSRYVVALKAERTANGVPLLEDIPVIGALWRPLPNREKSLQQNIIMAQATIFPTLFDLMGLRWAPAISDLDPLQLSNREYLVRGRHQYLENRIYDYSSARVDEFLRIPEDIRRADLYRSQESISTVHPNGYRGRGLDYENSQMREGYNPEEAHVAPGYVPGQSPEGSIYLPNQQYNPYQQMPQGTMTMEAPRKMELAPPSRNPGISTPPSPPKAPPNRIPSSPTLNDSSSSRRSDGWQYQRAN